MSDAEFEMDQDGVLHHKYAGSGGTYGTAATLARSDHTHPGNLSFQSEIRGACDNSNPPQLLSTYNFNSLFVFINGVATHGEEKRDHSTISYAWVLDTSNNSIYFNAGYDTNDAYVIKYEG